MSCRARAIATIQSLFSFIHFAECLEPTLIENIETHYLNRNRVNLRRFHKLDKMLFLANKSMRHNDRYFWAKVRHTHTKWKLKFNELRRAGSLPKNSYSS